MDNETAKEQQTRERAFHLWQEAGSSDGRPEEFWHKAKEDISKQKPVPEKVTPVKAPLKDN